jgi:NAD(P)-dependent dehydrogenase (short-subunit alcohol dehydrogenase family)
MRFDEASIPDQTGRVAVVTGSNSGIGWEVARMLAAKGGEVILACRRPERASSAVDALRAVVPDAKVATVALDLADLSSVASAAEELTRRHAAIHLLVNNAGVMAPPYGTTKDGFESQFGTNHLGHFALTGRLVPRLVAAGAGARIVNVASQAHRMGRMVWPDPNAKAGYERWQRYGQSKLANLLFTSGLVRRLSGTPVIATACHPGWSATELQANTARASGFEAIAMPMMKVANWMVAQSAAMGALPTAMAATSPDVGPGDYCGPRGIGQWRGYPEKVDRSAAARNDADAERLWALSEELTGVRWPLASA